jgi:hypothetical protein
MANKGVQATLYIAPDPCRSPDNHHFPQLMDFVCVKVKVKGLADIATLRVLLKSNVFGQVGSCSENQVSLYLEICPENYRG